VQSIVVVGRGQRLRVHVRGVSYMHSQSSLSSPFSWHDRVNDCYAITVAEGAHHHIQKVMGCSGCGMTFGIVS